MTEQEKSAILIFGIPKGIREEVESAKNTEDRDAVNNYMDKDKLKDAIKDLKDELRKSINYNKDEVLCEEDNERRRTIVEKIDDIIESILNDENKEITTEKVTLIDKLMSIQMKSIMINKNA